MAEAPAGSGTPPPDGAAQGAPADGAAQGAPADGAADGAAHGAADGAHTVEVPASSSEERQHLLEHVASVDRRLSEITSRLAKAEASAAAARKTPAWQRVTDGETRVQVGIAFAVL